MTEQHSHINITENISQEPAGISGHSKTVGPDESSFTLEELLLGLWNDLETRLETDNFNEKLEKEYLLEQEQLGELHLTEVTRKELRKEPPTLADVVMKFLKSPPAIVESLHNIDNTIAYLCDIREWELEAYVEQTEVIKETNRHLGNIAKHLEEPPEDTPQASRPFKPPPTDQGGRYVKF